MSECVHDNDVGLWFYSLKLLHMSNLLTIPRVPLSGTSQGHLRNVLFWTKTAGMPNSGEMLSIKLI